MKEGGTIKEMLTDYGLTNMLVYLVVVYFAFKEFVTNKDWLVGWVKGIFDKDYAAKEKEKQVESRVDNLERFLDEKKKVDEEFSRLRTVDDEILKTLASIKATLNEHIRVDDERNADSMREYILRFNVELIRNLKHTREDFIEVLAKIDEYERYCVDHEDYRNSRAVAAIDNIKRVYKDRLQKGDFL